jgi:hypothetical protein
MGTIWQQAMEDVMTALKTLRAKPEFQHLEDVFGAIALFVLLYAGLTLTGTA